ncbi:extracellular solute-binding protein [Phaeacidiphilus oryzae]|uniref:extracellular solute-binding protein n=1 Tax=Phaeacidiphilus oryzae TaxID=348818 RepID=UPI00056AC5A0|nr:extracellular solute-binding protein [Phaeacidiphilus oryzae]
MRTRLLATAAVAAALSATLAGCGGTAGGGSSKSIKVIYWQQLNSANKIQANYLKTQAAAFEKANPGTSVQLVPVTASENDFYTKIDLMMRAPSTTPDLVYEDTATLNSDVASGYLAPLDQDLSSWSEWQKFAPAAKAAVRGTDGKTYAVPDETDTRGIWYNKQLFAKAGLPVPWQPKSWADVLSAARAIKAKVPGAVPLNIYTGKAGGEASSMQGLEMLLYGTPAGSNSLYDARTKKWVVGSQQFKDALQFVKTVYSQGLGPTPSQALSANFSNTISDDLLPSGKLAMDIDGSWMPQHWIASGDKPWPQWSSTMATAPMPTQNGQAPGQVSMSGGWAWSIPAKARNSSLAWKFVQYLNTEQAATQWNVVNNTIAVRSDVAADPKYLKSVPTNAFFTGLVKHTYYRPALPVYTQVSTAIQDAMESVTTGQSSVAAAASTYDSAVKAAVGAGNTETGGNP